MPLSVSYNMTIVPYLTSALASIAVLGYLIAKIFPWIKYDFTNIRIIAQVCVRRLQYRNKLLIEIFEEKVDKIPKKTFLIFQDERYSYEFADKQMNKIARTALTVGIKKGDIVAVLMTNSPNFIWTAYGLYKIGVQPAFLNYNIRSKSLLHCINVSDSKRLLVESDEKLITVVEELYPDLEAQGIKVYVIGAKDKILHNGFQLLDDIFANASDQRPIKNSLDGIDYCTPICYIFTSGTTGLPKAAIISQDKAVKGALLMNMASVGKNDIVYTPLPLYHSAAGLIALGVVVVKGATLVLSSKFSASHFMEDCCKHKVTAIQYIGELCRYLCLTPKSPNDKNHCIRVAVGNGLRPDIWKEFSDRFNIPNIFEFYAATEGNVILFNPVNKFGSIGRSSPLLELLVPIAIIKFDVITEQPVRGDDGFCKRVAFNEPGLMVALIKNNFKFDGYKGNRSLSEKKVLRDVFKKGDLYFNSGDLMELDEDYFIYFKDRTGDTFRWKGENVSTGEVANVLTDISWIEDANVYGVHIPGQDGRAGMASLSLMQGDLSNTDLQTISDQCCGLLPSYAWPRFIRIQNTHNMTSTFKLQKMDLVKEGFDPEKVKPNPLYYLDLGKRTYLPLTAEPYHNIVSGKIRL